MVWGCISAYGMGSLHIWLHQCWKVYRGFRATCSHLDDVFFREGLAYSSKTMLNHILYLLQQHVFVEEESGCWTGLPAVQTFHQLKTFGASWNENKTKKTQDCWAAWILYQTRMGQHSSNWSPQFPDVYGLLLKEEEMLHSGKHGPVPTFLRRVAAIKFKITLFFP